MKYRPEIDGLRAFAVVPVILFHAGFEMFSGGFVGVDIFFVISGYLVTYIIINELERGDFSIVQFYERRARRILPALFFMMACCVPFATLWMNPWQYTDFSQSIVAVVVFSSNILFWIESGYFEVSSEEKPLLHTWSLGVEEQFYLVLPIFLILLWRFGSRRVFYAIITIALASLLLSEWGWRNKPTANFYLAPTRMWELLAGSLCAFVHDKDTIKTNEFLSGIGLTLIVFSILVFTENTPFPSFYALLPVVGTCLIILFGNRTRVSKLLSMRVFTSIGLISYSAYLWHQPLFAFARIRKGHEPEQWLMLLLAVISLILAYVSWKYVEQPFRKSTLKRRVPSGRAIFSLAALISCLFVTFGLAVDNTVLIKMGMSQKAYEYYQYLDYRNSKQFSQQYRNPGCFYNGNKESFDVFDKENCLRVSASKSNYLLLGDSHAAHLVRAIELAFPEHNIMQANASWCLPLIGDDGKKTCTDLYDYIFNDVIKSAPIDGVILAGRWSEEGIADNMVPTLAHIKKYVKNVIVLGPIVEYKVGIPRFLAKNSDNSPDQMKRIAYEKLVSKPFVVDRKMKNLLSDSEVTYVPLIPHICTDKKCTIIADDGAPMVFDFAHLTLSGAKTLINKLTNSGVLHMP